MLMMKATWSQITNQQSSTMKPSSTQCELADLLLMMTTASVFPNEYGDKINNELIVRVFKALDEHHGQVIDG